MKVPDYKRAGEDETGPLPKPITIKTDSQDAQIAEVTTAMQGRMNFQDNFSAVVLAYECVDSGAVRLSVKALKAKPTRLMVDWTSVFSPYSFCWRVIDAQTVEVLIQWADPPSGRAKARITVFSD